MANDIKNIESPCIRNCCLDENDICLGCYRSLSEITGWGQAGSKRRHVILLNAKKREEGANKIPS